MASGRRRILLSIPKVGAGILIAAGLVMLINFGHQAIQANRSSSWPTVEGTVTESKVVQRTGRRGRKTDIPSITYRYSVGGVEHLGTRLFFGSQYPESWTNGAKWTTDTKEYIGRYPPGASLRVHYDPDDAATSVVEAGLKSAIVLPVVLSILFIAAGVVVGIVEPRLRAKLARRESASMKAT
jgi:Protein of unknown function (DUF3592)